MKQIEVDPEARSVRAGGGVTWGELDQATQAHALATTGGVVSTTGIAGLTLGGGIGLLARRFGLASDNLLAVEIVTADGQLRTASATEHSDLFWAVRGGGGNFGVVTCLTYQLHPVGPEVFGGIVIHPFDRARDVFRFYRDEIAGAPDELTVYPGMLTGPDGDLLVALVVCYSGPIDQTERILAPLRSFGPPVADLLTEMPYTAMQQLFDPAYPSGRRNYWKSNFTDELSDEAIDTAIAWFQKVPSPWSTAALEHLGGAVSRIDRDATAFSQRDAQHTWTIASGWADPAEDEVNIQWARDFWQAMQPFTRPGVYVNYLQADEQDRIRAAYGDKYDRLATLKATYDPTNLFRMNQNISPAS
jgi:FAD/FMN-containing dehydrogenase